jgi:hypothetical protein
MVFAQSTYEQALVANGFTCAAFTIALTSPINFPHRKRLIRTQSSVACLPASRHFKLTLLSSTLSETLNANVYPTGAKPWAEAMKTSPPPVARPIRRTRSFRNSHNGRSTSVRALLELSSRHSPMSYRTRDTEPTWPKPCSKPTTRNSWLF